MKHTVKVIHDNPRGTWTQNAKSFTDTCSRHRTRCGYDGYPNPNNCFKCICPDGIGGRHCDNYEKSIGGVCGGILDATKRYQTIQSPGYPYPGYGVGQKCSWILRAPEGKKVYIDFQGTFRFFCTTTCLDYVEVKDTVSFAGTGKRLIWLIVQLINYCLGFVATIVRTDSSPTGMKFW